MSSEVSNEEGTSQRAPETVVREDWMTQPKEGWLAIPKQEQMGPTLTEKDAPSDRKVQTVDLSQSTITHEMRKIGDGGAGWRLKALKRMKEHCKKGETLEDLARKRGYNLSELLEESNRHQTSRRRRRHHREEDRLDPARMRKPNLQDSAFTKRKSNLQDSALTKRKTESKNTTSKSPEIFNQFPSDGSFLENFMKVQKKEQEEEEESVSSAGNNQSVAEQLRKQLQSGTTSKVKSETVVLPMVESDGRAAAGTFGRESARKRRETDDSVDITTLYKRSKYGDDAFDIDKTLASNISKNKRFNQEDVDMEYDFDVGTDLYQKKSRKNRKLTLNQLKQREKREAIRDYRKMETIGERCCFCFGSKRIQKQLIVSIGTMSYLQLPSKGSLDPFHCLIVPLEHIPSTRQVDENVWTELRNFKKCLILMNQKMGKDVIFMETALHLEDHNLHAFIECIPVEPEVLEKAPLYFKKAIDDATADWSQHHSKRCIETGKKGLRGSIPENFPYFHVEFNISNAFVHVIDNEAEFDNNMGRRVLLSLLNRPVEEMYQTQQHGNNDHQKKMVEQFVKAWNPFDWTSNLD